MQPAASNNSKYSNLAGSRLINRNDDVLVGRDRRVVGTSRCDVRTAQRAVPTIYEMASNDWKKPAGRVPRDGPRVCHVPKPADARLCLAIIAGVLCSVIRARAQEPTPTPQTVGQPGVTIEEVIVTGSNIPTAEEVTPQPVYILNRDLIFQLGVRNATDLVQKLPTVSGISINENVNNNGNGQTEIDLR